MKSSSSSIHVIRGGSSGDDGIGSSTYPHGGGAYDANSNGPATVQAMPSPSSNNNNYHQNAYSQTSSSSGEYGNSINNISNYSDGDPMLYEHRETVEARIDAWRRQQQVCKEKKRNITHHIILHLTLPF
jgi:hypothetical protein